MNQSVGSPRGQEHGLNTLHQVRVREFQCECARENARSTLTNSASELPSVVPSHRNRSRGNVASCFVPTLQSICAETLAQHFAEIVMIDALRDTDSILYDKIVDYLPAIDAAHHQVCAPLPLSACVARIDSEPYWKRCCEARWSLGQLSKLTGKKVSQVSGGQTLGWKRTYLEQILNDFLMTLRPESSLPDGQRSCCNVSPSSIIASGTTLSQHSAMQTLSSGQTSSATLSRAQLLSDMSSARSGDDAITATEETALQLSMSPKDEQSLTELCAICQDYVQVVSLPCQVVHLSLWSQLLSKLPHVHTLTLTYNVRNAGIGYDRRMTSFTDNDANHVREVLLKDGTLHTLRLPANKLLPRHVKGIASGMVDNHTLHTIDLSSNALDDTAAEVFALLLCKPNCTLEALYLHDNNIAAPGAHALSEALTLNTSLRVLHLSQNRIPDGHWSREVDENGDEGKQEKSGAARIIGALLSHDTLVELHLGYNKLSDQTVLALRETLPLLHTLQHLDIAGNRRIGKAAKQTSSLPTCAASSAFASVLSGAAVAESQSSIVERSLSSSSPKRDATMSGDTLASSYSHNHCQAGSSSGNRDESANAADTQAPRSDSKTTTTTALVGDEQSSQAVPHQASQSESTQPTTAALAAVEAMGHSDNGEMLCQAIRDQQCLSFFDARGCNLTDGELGYIQDVMLEHAHQRRMCGSK